MSKDQHMRELALEFQSSGLTRKIFCEQRSVRIHTLSYWLGQIKRENMSSGFIAVISGMVHASSGFELEYPNGVNIRPNVPSKQAINALLAFSKAPSAGVNMLQNINQRIVSFVNYKYRTEAATWRETFTHVSVGR